MAPSLRILRLRTGAFTIAFVLATATLAPRLMAQNTDLPNAPTPNGLLTASLSAQPNFNFFLADPWNADEFEASGQSSSSSSSLPQHPDQSAPSLSDLGLTADQTKSDPDAQARLDRRTHMLKVHQTLGLLTTVPILAACISSAGATPDRGSYGNTTSRDVHVGIAGLAIGMYGATAYYAIRAPRIPDSGPTRGGIKLHKYLIWIHAPGMILTPILGTMAFNDIASGQRVTGIASAHGAVAVTTAIAYGASILAVSWPIKIPFMHHAETK